MTIVTPLGMHSLKGKMLVYLMLPTIIIILGTLAYWYHISLNHAISQAKENLSQSAETIAAKVNEENQLAVRTSEMMALAQQNGMFGNRSDSVNFVRSILERTPSLVGASIGYEPNADQQDHQYIDLHPVHQVSYIDETGRFLLYWYRDFDDPEKLVIEQLVDMETSLYYRGVHDLYLLDGITTTKVTEPYVYEGRMLVEYSTPIILNHEFKGITAVDRALADIQSFLIDIKEQLQIDVILLSKRGNIITTTLDILDLETKSITETAYANLFNKLRSPEFARTVLTETDPIDDEVYFFDSATISVGDWVVVVRRSETDVIGPIQSQFRPLLGIATASLVLVFILFWYFMSRTSRRINIAIRSLESLASGNLSIQVDKYMKEQDELGAMFKSFDRLIQASKDIDQVCSAIAAGDFSRKVIKRSDYDTLSDSINLMSAKRYEAEQTLLNQAEELRQTQQELVEAEKMSSLGNLVSGVAHEVNTPLGVCVTAASHLKENLKELQQKIESGSLSKSEFSEFITETDTSCDMLLKNMQRAADLISSFKRVAVDQTTEELRHLKVSEYFSEVLKSLYHSIKSTPIKISIRSSEQEPEIFADSGALAQIFTNLIMNSIIHGFENGARQGQIDVFVEYGEQIFIHYTDSGTGMSEETTKKVFDPFYTTNRTRGGSGLGMNIVYNLVVHRLKGQISVKPKEDQGVYFLIQFTASLPN